MDGFATLLNRVPHVLPLLLVSLAAAQDVHVQPTPSSVPAKQPKAIVSNVDLVLVPVTVTDPFGRIVTGLEKQHFEVSEDKARQEVRYFYNQDVPISLGIILDTSGSMKGAMEAARRSVKEFMDASFRDDEFFLITFNTKPTFDEGFTQDETVIDSRLLYTHSKGRTALLDAIYLGMEKLHSARYPRRALLVISDGGENTSRYTPGEIKRVVREADVQIYAIGVAGSDYNPGLLSDIAKSSGGRSFGGIDRDTVDKVAVSLRSQYVLGYQPANRARDGRYRRISVKVVPPKGLSDLHVTAKQGYYAPEK